MLPCSENTSPDNTICTDNAQDCPITFLKFVPEHEIDFYRSDDQYDVSQNTMLNNYLVTSKTATDNLPIRSTKLAYKVCSQSD